MIDIERTRKFVDQRWGDEIVPALIEYIRIPNKSPAFDPDWAAHGYMEEAVRLFEQWARAKLANVSGATLEVARLPDRTPVIVIDLPGQANDTVLLYGHLDKQPEMSGWADGYGPWIPRLEGDKLYGRGGADDGYCHVRGAECTAGITRPVGPVRPLRRPDRGLRGVRQLRPAILC